jgi:hypothetical protein
MKIYDLVKCRKKSIEGKIRTDYDKALNKKLIQK